MGCEGRVDKVIEGGMNNTKDFPKKSCGKLLLQNLSKIYIYSYNGVSYTVMDHDISTG